MARNLASVRRARPRGDDDALDSFDVPAAVLCAFCGQADCPGCADVHEQASGVIAIIPWERSNAGVWRRLWATATATTQGAEAFFAAMPDGEVSPAARFAFFAELLAVVSMAALLVPLFVLALPTLALAILRDPHLRGSALRWAALGVPGVVLWMVLAHVTHGVALDSGARRQGARPQRRRAVRFGLYACGWDLMAGPLGGVVTLLTQGLGPALALLDITMRVPGQASLAFLQSVYELPGEKVTRARRRAGLAAVLIALVSGVTFVGVVVVGLVH